VIVLGIALGAAVGAAIRSRLSTFAWRATLGLNVAGSLLLGFITGLDPGDAWLRVVGTGFCGALTTFATFAFEAYTARPRHRAVIIGCNVIGCVGAAWLGYVLASA